MSDRCLHLLGTGAGLPPAALGDRDVVVFLDPVDIQGQAIKALIRDAAGLSRQHFLITSSEGVTAGQSGSGVAPLSYAGLLQLVVECDRVVTW